MDPRKAITTSDVTFTLLNVLKTKVFDKGFIDKANEQKIDFTQTIDRVYFRPGRSHFIKFQFCF